MTDKPKIFDDLKKENAQLKAALAAATSELDLHDRYVKLVIKYWQGLTGCEMITPTIVETIEQVMDHASQVETLQEEIEELTEKLDEVNISHEWLLQRLGNYE
jgi:prefoldin subunit 5